MMNVSRRPSPARLLLSSDAVGGVFTYALDLARGLAAYGVETTLALLGPAASSSQRASAALVPGLELVPTGLPLDWLTEDRRQIADASSAIAALADRCRVDVVHLNTPSLACAHYGRPVVVGLHSCLATWWRAVKEGPMPADFVWRTDLTAEGLRSADACVGPTAAFAAEASSVYGVSLRAVHNGRAQPAMAEAAGPSGAFVFAAGRFWDEGKGLVTLVAATPKVGLPMVVAGPLTGPNGAQASAPGVVALGAVDEETMRQRLAQRPIFVSTALYEPFGLSVLEAAQAGCPLVLSDIPTFRELWSGAALFVSPRDPDAVARALNTLTADEACREQLAAAARERAARYTLEAMARNMMGVYENLLAERAGAAA